MSIHPPLPVRRESPVQPGMFVTGGSSQSAVLQQSASVFLAQVALLVCGVANSFLVAYLVGPEGRGLVYLMQFIAGGIGLTLLNFGLGPASVFYLGREARHSLSEVAAGVLWASLLLGALPMLLLVPAWHWIAGLATKKIAGAYLWLALGVIPAMNLTFNAGFLSLAQKRTGTYNWLRVSPSILFSLSLIVVLFSRSRTIWIVALTWTATSIVPGLFALEVIRRGGSMRWTKGVQKFLRDGLRFSWHSHLGAVTQYLQHRSDILLVSYFLPLKELGLYAFAVSLAELLWYVANAVGTVLMPHVAGSLENEASGITPMVCRATLSLTALLSVGLAAASSWLIPRILPAFETFYPAAIALGSGLVCGTLMIPRFGIWGAAVVSTFGYLLNATLYLRSYSRIAAVPIPNLLFVRAEDFSVASGLKREWMARSAGKSRVPQCD